MVTELSGLGGVIFIVFFVLMLCCICVYCCMKLERRGHQQQNEQSSSHSMVYSVTMQGGNGALLYNSVTEYVRNSQTNQDDLEVTAIQRQLNGNFINKKLFTPKGLPSYDDVISGKFDRINEPPPPYLEAANCLLFGCNEQPVITRKNGRTWKTCIRTE